MAERFPSPSDYLPRQDRAQRDDLLRMNGLPLQPRIRRQSDLDRSQEAGEVEGHAREFETDEEPVRLDQRVKKLLKRKPVEKSK